MPVHSLSLVLVHVVWATKGRHPTLPAALDGRLIQGFSRKASELQGGLLAAGCSSDHVHLLLRLAPTTALSDLVKQLKGVSAHDTNQARLLAQPLVWQAGYWAESFGPSAQAALEGYVRGQRRHHATSDARERWEQ
jgi:REP element-mobilizing transposase RayT